MQVTLNLDQTTILPSEIDPSIRIEEGRTTIRSAGPYIAKVQSVDHEPYYTNIHTGVICPTQYDMVRNEIIISQKAGELNVGPRIYNSALNSEKGILVMDRYDGNLGELFYLYQTDRTIPVDKVMEVVKQLLSILHQNNIIHRDIHPMNILYTKGGIIAIADYGLSMISDSEDLKRFDREDYESMADLLEEIRQGRTFENPRAISFAMGIKSDHNFMINWNGNICPTW